MSDNPRVVLGDNLPPIVPPSEADLLADLTARHPTVEARFKELSAAAATVPVEIKDEETAKKVQDLLKSMTAAKAAWKALRDQEKGGWDRLAKTAYNFFIGPAEKLDVIIGDRDTPGIKARYDAYLEAKAEAARIETEKRAKEERDKAARVRKEAEEAETRRLQAIADAEAAEERERKARAAVEQAERDRIAAEERRAAAEEAERQALARRREREANERAALTLYKQQMTAAVREAKDLSAKEMAGTANDAEKARLAIVLDELATLNRRLAGSEEFLTPEQIAERQSEQREIDTLKRIQDEAATAAKAAKAIETAAKKDVRAAMGDHRAAVTVQKSAATEQRVAERAAEKTEARADRLDRKLLDTNDAEFSRLRGVATVGSLAGRWYYDVTDFSALPAEALWAYVSQDAKSAAVYRYMVDNARAGNTPPALEGAIFEKVKESRIA